MRGSAGCLFSIVGATILHAISTRGHDLIKVSSCVSVLLCCFSESSYVCEAVAETELLVSMDMVEVNPQLASRGETDATLDLATSLVVSSLGKNIL